MNMSMLTTIIEQVLDLLLEYSTKEEQRAFLAGYKLGRRIEREEWDKEVLAQCTQQPLHPTPTPTPAWDASTATDLPDPPPSLEPDTIESESPTPTPTHSYNAHRVARRI